MLVAWLCGYCPAVLPDVGGMAMWILPCCIPDVGGMAMWILPCCIPDVGGMAMWILPCCIPDVGGMAGFTSPGDSTGAETQKCQCPLCCFQFPR